MATIKIEIDPKLLQVSEWALFTPPIVEYFPRVYKIADGTCKIYLTSMNYLWMTPADATTFLAKITDETTKEIPPAPNVGISEGFILRALAIAQDPSLAKELV